MLSDQELFECANMAASGKPDRIKKYANRRLYNTATSSYVTLEHLASMVKRGDDFVVHDGKTGEDITRSVLTQVIFEQEDKQGQSLLPINFLRHLIRFYGDSLQMFVARYLEVSLEMLTRDQEKFRKHMAQVFGPGPFSAVEEQARRNRELFARAFAMFSPFGQREVQSEAGGASATPTTGDAGKQEIEGLRRQVQELQQRLDQLSENDKS
jgi:polyhydroxyalkanoate synthesis repressor PhaR